MNGLRLPVEGPVNTFALATVPTMQRWRGRANVLIRAAPP